jgi:hypothetical protein
MTIESILSKITNFVNKQFVVLILLSILITLSMMYTHNMGYKAALNNQKVSIKVLDKTLKTVKDSIEVSSNLALQEERITSLNKRFDDFYVLGGIILTLMFILVASVYIKSEKDVKTHLDQNFEAHKEEIQAKLDKATEFLSEIETTRALVSQAKVSIQNDMNSNGAL